MRRKKEYDRLRMNTRQHRRIALVMLVFGVLAFVPVLFDALRLDPLFRAIEKMHMLSVRFVLSQAVVVVLTLFLVKGDGDLLLLPVFDIIGAVLAACLSIMGARRLGYRVRAGSLHRAWGHIKESFIYFASNMSLTAFNALNTVIIGIAATPAEVAYWAVALQLMAPYYHHLRTARNRGDFEQDTSLARSYGETFG